MNTNVTPMEYEFLKRLIEQGLCETDGFTDAEMAMMVKFNEQKICTLYIGGGFALNDNAHLAIAEYEFQQASLAKQRAEQEATEARKQQLDNKRYRKDIKRSWWQFWLGLFLGWILGGFTAKEAYLWIIGLF